MNRFNLLLCVVGYFFANSNGNAQTHQSTPNNATSNDAKRSTRRAVAIVLASDGALQQATVDFYRAVYKTVATGSNWDAIPISTLRQTMNTRESNRLGGIPTVDRASFRKNLPRKSTRKGKTKTTPGTPNPEIQRLLDNLGSPASIVVDCTRMGRDLLKSCALYYYDRVATHVTASTVKEFTAGANDATVWAAPMIRNLDEGIAASQREKDQAMIDELVARKEDDDDEDVRGTVSIFGRGDRMRLSTGWSQTVAGGGLQLGFLRNNIGVNAELARLSWQGDGSVKSAQRTSYGLNMEFRAKALESLLWLFEIGGGKDDSKFKGPSSDDNVTISAAYINVGPGIGLDVNDNVTMDLGLNWRWFFEQSSSKSGTLSDASMSASNVPGLTLRATLQL